MAPRVNRRNYYRILHVQPDAPVEIVRASYRTLMHKLRYHPDLGGDDWNAALLNEALQVLTDAERRAAYDRERVVLLRDEERGTKAAAGVPQTRKGPAGAGDEAPASTCPFCALPLVVRTHSSCVRCNAPLLPPHAVESTLGEQRRYARLALNAPLLIHPDWSSTAGMSGRIRDLSPGGMQAEIASPLGAGQIVLLGSELLDAVGQVATCFREGGSTVVGFGFLTLRFHEPRGTFISARA